jgi:hypothetical protein
MSDIVDTLASSPNPIVAYKARTMLLGEDPRSRHLTALRRAVAASPMAQSMLRPHDRDVSRVAGPYKKWQGPHWTLVSLAQICYPPGDPALFPLRDRIYDWLLSPRHLEFPRSLAIPGQEDRFRHCASIEGNAIWASIRLGIDDGRTRELAAQLARWQWPDGGWNCDKRPAARVSSVIETCIPLRGLALAAASWSGHGAPALRAAADRAAEYFLSHGIFRRRRDGEPIKADFATIRYPIQFYDVLYALVVMAEAGKIRDPRCAEALDLLEAKRLPDGGFPAERRTARTSASFVTNGTFADWGAFGKRRMNELVTVDALWALMKARRSR